VKRTQQNQYYEKQDDVMQVQIRRIWKWLQVSMVSLAALSITRYYRCLRKARAFLLMQPCHDAVRFRPTVLCLCQFLTLMMSIRKRVYHEVLFTRHYRSLRKR